MLLGALRGAPGSETGDTESLPCQPPVMAARKPDLGIWSGEAGACTPSCGVGAAVGHGGQGC